ncbi:ATPase_2 domain-containing protein [Methanocaldococcus lauensis]|uniref:ATPase_2 domain-containing protein n=1 Tax=Methanocaldococcus lauensis TaxID=2546128 RepID=A0A8D6SVD5_9EURY|nr:ATP-binding protein [Methanocaldococcus lauensis]CAB3287590.1 ATPase_2 domain-containing protein [Methanocaldococcus lauensis]
MKLFNREKEINEILHIIEREPDDIYFIFGPINSGKSTLIREIITNRLDKNKYIPFFIDFRARNIVNVDNFIECLFEVDEKSKVDDFREYAKSLADLLVKGSEELTNYYLGMPIKIPKSFFDKIFNKKDKSGDVYQYIEYLFAKLNEKGKKPILIFDELQMIKEITLNGDRLLLWSLFQFLVTLTKVQHLCYVFCISSDSLFIEYVYNAGELEGRAKYILVDDFDKDTALKFIDFLSEINNIKLTNEERELIYSYVGGKPKDIKYVIEESKFKDLREILNEMLKIEVSKLKYFLEDVKEDNEEFYKEVVKALSLFKENYIIEDIKIPKKIREFLIKKNILFLNPIDGNLKPQSFLVWNAIKRVL